MERFLSIFLNAAFFFLLVFLISISTSELPTCKRECGSLEVKYPFGSAPGCGSPRFSPYVSCATAGDKLLLTTHTGSYPITSISYDTSTLIISPTQMSTCLLMQPASNLGLDWPGPFQLGPSTFVLLGCRPPTSSLTANGSPVCDLGSARLCASLHACPAVLLLGLPLFAPTNTCCVYSPANLNPKSELDPHELKCAGYASIASLGDDPTDPAQWEYGVALKYNNPAGSENDNLATKCEACERSGGACGYALSENTFSCICGNGLNSTMDCNSLNGGSITWSSGYGSPDKSCFPFSLLIVCQFFSFYSNYFVPL